jgi:outer membrane protein TolC
MTLACLSILVSVRLEAQEPPPARLVLSLDEAHARGLEASHRLAELRARERAAEATVDSRRVADWPIVALQGAYTRTSNVPDFGIVQPDGSFQIVFPNIPDRARARLDLRWPIYEGGRDDALERAARAEREATGADLAVARLDLRLEITRAYWANITAAEAVRVLEGSLRRMDGQLQSVRDRLAVGLIPPNEVLSVEAERSRQEVLLIEARNQSALAAADLARLLGLELGTTLVLTAPLEDAALLPEPADRLQAEALARRPERQALLHRIEAAGTEVEAAAAAKKPEVAVAGGYDYARPNPLIVPPRPVWRDSWDVGLSARWALWDGGRARAEMAEASANQSALRERLAEFDSLLALEVRQRVLDLDSAQAASRAARDGLRAATDARRVVLDRFTAGVATSLDQLDVEEDLLQAELGLTRALANIRMAEARLERALGR